VLANFIFANREVILGRARARVASRTSPTPSDVELTNGIPVFLDQLGDALRMGRSSDAIDHEALSASAGRHGGDLFRMGLTTGQVVHDYGDVCQVVTELAVEQKVPISAEEFRRLNLCIDDAIAGAMTEYSRQRERVIVSHGTARMGVLAHELRNLLNTAMLAFDSIKTGRVAVGGSTGLVLGRSLGGLRDLIDRSLADVRLDAGIEHVERIVVAELVEEVEIGTALQAEARGLRFTVHAVDRTVAVDGDRQILAAALSNLLHNAIKFTRKGGAISLTTEVTNEAVRFHVEDECGGLPPGSKDALFRPFEQRGDDLTGLGLGLAICRKAAQASGGTIGVRDLAGKGCIFTLELPKQPPPPT
jgi:signal transduction histidine kinase